MVGETKLKTGLFCDGGDVVLSRTILTTMGQWPVHSRWENCISAKLHSKWCYFSFKTSSKAMTPRSHRIFSMIWPHTPIQFHLAILFTLCFMLWNSKLSRSPPALHRIPTLKPHHIPVLSQSWAKAPPPGIQAYFTTVWCETLKLSCDSWCIPTG